jgi:hypothetical protein
LKNKVLIALGLVILTTLFHQVQADNINDSNTHADTAKINLFDSYKTLLDPVANKAIREKFPNRSYGLYDTSILDIERIDEDGYSFRVKASYHTYTGAHNPPRGIDTLTFEVTPSGTKVIDYEHREFIEKG